MKITIEQFTKEQQFWEKTLFEQTEAYLKWFIEAELMFIERYRNTPVSIQMGFIEKCFEALDKLKGINDSAPIFLRHSPHAIACTIIYVISGVTNIGFTQRELTETIGRMTSSHFKGASDLLINTYGIIDWYKQTEEYQEWLKRTEWIKEHPNYFKMPEDPSKKKEHNIKMRNAAIVAIKTGSYSKHKVLSKLK